MKILITAGAALLTALIVGSCTSRILNQSLMLAALLRYDNDKESAKKIDEVHAATM